MRNALHPLLTSSPALRAIVAISLGLWGATCVAQSDAQQVNDLRFSGFGTLGVVHANAPEGWSFRRDIGQVGSSRSTRFDTDSRLGLQVNDQATSQIELVGQLLLTRTSPYGNFSDGVQRAFVAWRPSPEWGVRVGRVNLDQFLMSDYRNVGFTYPTVRPPVDFYGLQASSLDGGDLTRSWDFGDAQWRVKGFAGRAHSGDLAGPGGYSLINSIIGLVVSREAGGLLLRASASRVKIDHVVDGLEMLDHALSTLTALPFPSVVDEAGSLRQRLDYARAPSAYVSVATNYDLDDWQFTAEASRVFGPPLVRYENAYFRVARRFGPVTTFGGFSRTLGTYSRVQSPNWEPTLAPALGDAAAQQVQFLGSTAASAVNSAAADQHTLSAGARWDIHSQLAFKLQWDRIDTGRDGARLWADGTGESARSNVMTATLDFIF